MTTLEQRFHHLRTGENTLTNYNHLGLLELLDAINLGKKTLEIIHCLPLDRVIETLQAELGFELNPELKVKPMSFLWLVEAKVVVPVGSSIETSFRYDAGKRWIIDPLVQKGRYPGPYDNQTWEKLAGQEYLAAVSEKITELFQANALKFKSV